MKQTWNSQTDTNDKDFIEKMIAWKEAKLVDTNDKNWQRKYATTDAKKHELYARSD